MPTPADVVRARVAAQQRELTDAAHRAIRVAWWNAQMRAVVETIVEANAAGVGLVIDVSFAANSITARVEHRAPLHTAYIFDHDTGAAPYRRTIRLTREDTL